jgi:hypothetical protein
MDTLHEYLRKFLHVEVAEWEIPSPGIPRPFTNFKGQILATIPQLLRYAYISHFVQFQYFFFLCTFLSFLIYCTVENPNHTP